MKKSSKFLVCLLLFIFFANVSHAESLSWKAKINAAKSEIRKEPKVLAISNDTNSEIEWTIGVKDNGTEDRYGVAEYVCHILSKNGLIVFSTDVRVVDHDKIVAGETPVQASLGRVNCETHAQAKP